MRIAAQATMMPTMSGNKYAIARPESPAKAEISRVRTSRVFSIGKRSPENLSHSISDHLLQCSANNNFVRATLPMFKLLSAVESKAA